MGIPELNYIGHENSTNGSNKIKLKGQESTEDITVSLPTTAGTIVSTGDTGTNK